MTLPASRNTTYAAGSQVKSADLNDIQDCIISSKQVARTMLIGAAEGMSSQAVGTPLVFSTTGSSWSFGASVEFLFFPIRAVTGDRITGWKLFLNKTSNGSGIITGVMQKVDQSTGTITSIGSSNANSLNNPGSTTVSITGLTETATIGFYYFVRVQDNGVTGDSCRGCEITFDRP
jgi:hypothetical protein